jgi:hypothetical protein
MADAKLGEFRPNSRPINCGEERASPTPPGAASGTASPMAGLPLDANVLFMTVMASKIPFVGRG